MAQNKWQVAPGEEQMTAAPKNTPTLPFTMAFNPHESSFTNRKGKGRGNAARV